MARGGRRQGTPGSQYSNRSDLRQAPVVAKGQQYGQAQQQLEAQRAIPLPSTPPPTAQPAPPPPAAMMPGQAGPLDRPTERPNEPVTTGLSTGPGAGPEALNMMPTVDTVAAQLHQLYRMNPNDDLARLLELRQMGY